MASPRIVEKEMGITHREFFRVISRALAGRPHTIGENNVRVAEGDRILDITISEEGERRIALMTVPVTRVRLAFSGYSESKTAETVVWFDRWFQRGGG